MRKKVLIKKLNKQNEIIENLMDIFKILVEGGGVSVHINKEGEPSYFVDTKDKKSNAAIFSKKIYEGLFSRGLLVLDHDVICDNFVAQHYVLRISKDK